MKLCFETPDVDSLAALATALDGLAAYLQAVASALRQVQPPSGGETPETPAARTARGR